MILLTILTIILLILIVVAIAALSIGGAFGIILFGDIIVCVALIVFALRSIIKKRKKRRGF